MSLYQYAGNNGPNAIDPSGHSYIGVVVATVVQMSPRISSATATAGYAMFQAQTALANLAAQHWGKYLIASLITGMLIPDEVDKALMAMPQTRGLSATKQAAKKLLEEGVGQIATSGKTTVYRIFELVGGKRLVRYVGITDDFPTRQSQHRGRFDSEFGAGNWEMEKVDQLGRIARAEARAVEETLMVLYGGVKRIEDSPLFNAIASVSGNNPLIYHYLRRGVDLLKNIGFEDIIRFSH